MQRHKEFIFFVPLLLQAMQYIFLTIIYFFLTASLAAQDMQNVRAYIDTLAAPGMHGRGYVNNGDKIAANYLEGRFQETGLMPFNNSAQAHPFFQYFKVDINTFPGALCFKAGNHLLQPGKDFILNPASGSGKGAMSVRLLDTMLFCSKKIQKKFLNTKSTSLALVFESKNLKQIQSLPKNLYDKFYSFGCLIELQEKKLTASLAPYQLRQPYFEIKKEAFPLKTQKISLEVDAELKKKYESQNVIGYIKGKKIPDSFMVISAHYDHLGRMGKDIYFPGANDNASGISMLLELAKYYSKAENQLDYSIAFIAFGAEEAGLIGSKHYVDNPLFPLKKIKFLINLDLLGTGEEGITVVNGTKFPAQFEKLVQLNEEKKYLTSIKQRGPAANSDHYFFTEKGVPAFFIYTMGGIAASMTSLT